MAPTLDLSQKRQRRRRIATSVLSALLAVQMLPRPPAHAYPASVFATTSAVPTPGQQTRQDAPEEKHVDPTGAASYSIALPFPPNRRDFVPRLSLQYSSRNPVRGGLAMGWTLAIPRIEIDTRKGRLGEVRYRASQGGKLIRVDEPVESGWEAFRGEEDSTYSRYERKIGTAPPPPPPVHGQPPPPPPPATEMWRVRAPDGTVHYFGETPASKDEGHGRAEPSAAEYRWFLTRSVDAYGNEIVYHYTKVMGQLPEGGGSMPVDVSLDRIEYGANANAGLAHHTKIHFDHAASFDLCPGSVVPIGAKFDFRSGIPVYEGARRLTAVRVETGAAGALVERRKLTFEYDQRDLSCAPDMVHAPLRILRAVQESATAPDGTITAMPPQTFDYGRLERTFDASRPVEAGTLGRGLAGLANNSPRNPRHITQTMLLDVDGDGLVDRLDLDTPAANGNTPEADRCTGTWRRNDGVGFAPPEPFGVTSSAGPALPTVPWEDPGVRGILEQCSLTHQISRVENDDVFDPDDLQDCQFDPEVPYQSKETQNLYRYMDWNHDGLVDLVTAVESRRGTYRPELDPNVGPDPSCPGWVCPGTEVPGIGCIVPNEDPCLRREERACDGAVVRVHLNLGDGLFGAPVAVLSPVPLDDEERPNGATFELLADLDGDGREDGVVYTHASVPGAPPNTAHYYNVLRGAAGGTFAATAFAFELPVSSGFDYDELTHQWLWGYAAMAPSIRRSDQYVEQFCTNCEADPEVANWIDVHMLSTQVEVAKLSDVNGDGLSDYLMSQGTGLRVFYNTGRRFETYDYAQAWNRGSRLTTHPAILASGVVQNRPLIVKQNNQPPAKLHDGFSRDVIRQVDFDGDGLLDIVKLPDIFIDDPGSPDFEWDTYEPRISLTDERPKLFVNVGDRYVELAHSDVLDRAVHGLSKRIVTQSPGFAPWRLQSDFVDLDGDGLPEAVEMTPAAEALYDSDAQPMRLLRQVNNGKGGHIHFHYALARGAGPSPVWVVDQLSTWADSDAEGAQTPLVATHYQYLDPVYGPDWEGDHAFRGFVDVTVVAPTGSKTRTLRSYGQHYAGLVVDERVYTASDELIRRTQTLHEERTLFGGDAFPGTVRTFHPVQTDTRVCETGQSLSDCIQNGKRVTTESFWISLAPPGGGQPAMHHMVWDRQGETFGMAPGSRVRSFGADLVHTATSYLKVPNAEVTSTYDASLAVEVASETYHYYDPSKRFELWTSRKVDHAPTWAITSHLWDMDTGNPTGEVSPRYVGTGPASQILYDADRRFVSARINPLGHQVNVTTDPATGVEIGVRGPNKKPCGAGCEIEEGTTKTIDGFGRVLSESVYLDHPTAGYAPEIVVQRSFLDAGPRPMVTELRKIDIGGTRWARTETESDGLGRKILTRAYEGNQVRAETRLFHDARGLVTLAKVPRPASYNLQLVEQRFEYDDLGRMVAAREPSRAGCTGPITLSPPFAYCGKRWAYSGRSVTEETVVGTLGGKVSSTRTTHDALGRLAKVEEALDANSWAVTLYAHDGNDSVTRVVNADGVVTEMEHDLLGRRTAITRGDQTWVFEYDLDSNLTDVTSPVPAGADPELYTTKIKYDAIGRELLRTPAVRDWDAATLARFGTGRIERLYDTGTNGVGRLSTVTQEWGGSDHHTVTYGHDARGFVSTEAHAYSIEGGTFADARTVTRSYTAQGLPSLVTEADGPSPATSTVLGYTYDDRGLPQGVHWMGHGTGQQVQRMADGRVYHRFFSQPGAVIAQATSNFDDAGRTVWYQVKSRLPGEAQATERAVQAYWFDGAGHVTRLDSRLSPTTPGPVDVAEYSYDSMGRLLTATGDKEYSAQLTYSPGGRVIAAQIGADPTAPRVHARDVAYTYGGDLPGTGADPDAPVVLATVGGGPFMELAYDPAGNVTERSIPGLGAFTHLHDGLDRQREVVSPDGASETYYYDAGGRRALTVERDAGGAVTRVKWSVGGSEIWYDGDGNPKRATATSTFEGSLFRVVNQDHREFLFQDPRGHVLASINDQGSMVAGFSYGPYGELLREEGPGHDETLERFNGKPWDATSGLSYYGFRYYDERTLTWTQADPKYRWAPEAGETEPRRGSLYSFSLGNPVSMVDPDGREPQMTWQIFLFNAPVPALAGEGTAAPSFTGVPHQIRFEARLDVDMPQQGGAKKGTAIVSQRVNVDASGKVDWLAPVAMSGNAKQGSVVLTGGSLQEGKVQLALNGISIVTLTGNEFSGGISREGGSWGITGQYTRTYQKTPLEVGGGAGTRKVPVPVVVPYEDEQKGMCAINPDLCLEIPAPPPEPEPYRPQIPCGIVEIGCY